MATAHVLADSTNDAHWERQYLDLMRRIWTDGDERVDRTGVGTRAIFGPQLRFDLGGGAMPLLTTKRVYWKAATREMLWFLTGDTNIRSLCTQGVEIWTDWPLSHFRKATGEVISRDEFSARIVADASFAANWGDLGPIYGKQWVDWPTYEPFGEGLFREGRRINQVAVLIDSLRDDPGSRRHIIEGWNVADLDQMALPPCHKTYQFQVAGDRLHCQLYQRSCDVALGLPFNLWGAALLTRMVAQQVDLEPGELIWTGGDTHLYANHGELVEEQLARTPTGTPRLEIIRRPPSMFDYRIEDFVVHDYVPHPSIKAPIAV